MTHEYSMETRIAILERVAQDMDKLLKDHETRLRRMERWFMYGAGVTGVVSLILHAMEQAK